ncbi:uncharacterized protein [Hetaerina americana]
MTKADLVIASSPPQDQVFLDAFKALGCEITNNNEKVVKESDVVVLAVKPNVMNKVLQSVKTAVTNEKLFISVAMGIEIGDIKEVLHPSTPKIARVMPNTCVSVGKGASAFVASEETSAETVAKLFSAVGTCHRLMDESHLDTVTALSGAGPAYLFTVAEALADGGVKMGLQRALAVNLVSQTMLGAATMIQETGQHTAVLRDEVTSPGGNTIEGLHFLEKSGMRAAIIGAIEASTIKCKSTNKELKEHLRLK